jgi:hypothetical protein
MIELRRWNVKEWRAMRLVFHSDKGKERKGKGGVLCTAVNKFKLPIREYSSTAELVNSVWQIVFKTEVMERRFFQKVVVSHSFNNRKHSSADSA